MTNTGEGLPIYDLFTDGACDQAGRSTGPGGWGFILRVRSDGSEVEGSGGEPETTNNRMEMLAVINGLESIEGRARVIVHSDSEYFVKGVNEWLDGWKRRGWKKADRKPVANRELWERIDALRGRHELDVRHVRGHSGHEENERCDQLAVAARHAVAGTQPR